MLEEMGRRNRANKREVLSDKEKQLKEAKDIPKEMDDLKKRLEERMGLNQSFDVVLREMEFGKVKTGLLYINGFAKDDVLTEIYERLSYLNEEQLKPDAIEQFMNKFVLHIQVELAETLPDAVNKSLAGMSVLFIEGETKALCIDAKQFPVRSIEEPALEKVVRGSRDGFVETLLTNVTLVRRRLRDPRLKYEIMQIGERSKTDVCIGYINDIADMDLVESVRDKLNSVKLDGIPLADKQLQEAIVGPGFNPFPLVRFSERPDVVANHLLEGHVMIFVDTSPSAIILPTTYFHHVQHAEEYTQLPIVGTYLRWVRFFGILASIFLLPLWFLFVMDPGLKPDALDFLGPQNTDSKLPLILQFILAEVGIDLMRMAAVHTPAPLATAMGLIAAILIGDIAVQTGLFVNEVILYIAVAGIGMFATPSYELSLANRMVRLVLLLAVAMFKIPGLVIGTTLILVLLITRRSYNSPYMWPFIPFDPKAFFTIIIRRPVRFMNRRLTLTKPTDSTRQPE